MAFKNLKFLEIIVVLSPNSYGVVITGTCYRVIIDPLDAFNIISMALQDIFTLVLIGGWIEAPDPNIFVPTARGNFFICFVPINRFHLSINCRILNFSVLRAQSEINSFTNWGCIWRLTSRMNRWLFCHLCLKILHIEWSLDVRSLWITLGNKQNLYSFEPLIFIMLFPKSNATVLTNSGEQVLFRVPEFIKN